MKKIFLYIFLTILALVVLIVISPTLLGLFFGKDEALKDDSKLEVSYIQTEQQKNAFYGIQKVGLLEPVLNSEYQRPLSKVLEGQSLTKEDKEQIKYSVEKNQEIINSFLKALEKNRFQIPAFSDNFETQTSESGLEPRILNTDPNLLALNTVYLVNEKKFTQGFESSIKLVHFGDLILNSRAPLFFKIIALKIKFTGLNLVQYTLQQKDLSKAQKEMLTEKLGGTVQSSVIGLTEGLKFDYQTNKALFLKMAINLPVNKRFFFKPNKTTNSYADKTNTVIKQIQDPCANAKIIYELAPIKENVFQVFENYIGKTLLKLSTIDSTNLSDKLCQEKTIIDQLNKN